MEEEESFNKTTSLTAYRMDRNRTEEHGFLSSYIGNLKK